MHQLKRLINRSNSWKISKVDFKVGLNWTFQAFDFLVTQESWERNSSETLSERVLKKIGKPVKRSVNRSSSWRFIWMLFWMLFHLFRETLWVPIEHTGHTSAKRFGKVQIRRNSLRFSTPSSSQLDGHWPVSGHVTPGPRVQVNKSNRFK